MIGAKFYSIPRHYDQFIQKWKASGLDTAFVGPEVWKNRDFCTRLQADNIDVYLIFPAFYEPELTDNSSSYAITENGTIAKSEWVQFACPNNQEFFQSRLSLLRQIAACHQPAGISIDFIRYFVFWEKVFKSTENEFLIDTCFCPECLREFEAYTGQALSCSHDQPKRAAEEIHTKHQSLWIRFKTSVITRRFAELAATAREVKKDVQIVYHGVPWFAEEWENGRARIAGQDFSSIQGVANIISPMCYTQMLRKDEGWVAKIVDSVSAESGTRVIPAVQVEPCYLDDSFSADDFSRVLETAFSSGDGSVILWSWEYLINSKDDKYQVFSDFINARK